MNVGEGGSGFVSGEDLMPGRDYPPTYAELLSFGGSGSNI